MASVTFKNLNKTYPNGFISVKNVSLHIKDGEFVAFHGPSGCGKSTILRMIGGLEDITSGEIYLGDDLLNDGTWPKASESSARSDRYPCEDGC